MAEPEDLQALISQNLPDNVNNFITPGRVRTVFNFLKDNYTPTSVSDTFLTSALAASSYLPLDAAEDFLSVPIASGNTYTSVLTYNSVDSEYYMATLIDGGVF